MPADPGYGFNLLFLKRFARLHNLLYPRLTSRNFLLLLILLAASGLEQYLAYRIGIMSGQFFKCLGEKKFDDFKYYTGINLAIVASISLTLSARILTTKSLIVGWRRSVCRYFHEIYLSGHNYYKLNIIDSDIDNPDQRITADVSSLMESYGNIIPKLVVTPFTIIYYAWDAYRRAGWIGPTGMFGLFVVSTLVNKILMKPVINTTVLKERKEGDFRFKHLQVRCNAESLAFHGSPKIEQDKVNEKLEDLCKVQQSLYFKNFGIDVSVNIFAYLGAIASYLVIAVPIFSGSYDDMTGAELSQAISENAFVCIYLISQLTNLVQITGIVASMAGSTHRVCELREKLEKYLHEEEIKSNNSLEAVTVEAKEYMSEDTKPLSHDDRNLDQTPPPSYSSIQFNSDNLRDKGSLVEFTEFSLKSPNSQTCDQNNFLVKSLNLLISHQRNVLVMGPSSSGKSSLLRAMRGLWMPESGGVQINSEYARKVYFLPQKPFFTNGTLREQIHYPDQVDLAHLTDKENEEIRVLLESAGLKGLFDRCGGLDEEPSWNWFDVLSPGEAQRLAFVRMLFHKPVLAVLDEATSAVSQDLERKLYSECLQQNITLLSVGHRDSLKLFHHQVLSLTGDDGGWILEDVVPAASSHSSLLSAPGCPRCASEINLSASAKNSKSASGNLENVNGNGNVSPDDSGDVMK